VNAGTSTGRRRRRIRRFVGHRSRGAARVKRAVPRVPSRRTRTACAREAEQLAKPSRLSACSPMSAKVRGRRREAGAPRTVKARHKPLAPRAAHGFFTLHEWVSARELGIAGEQLEDYLVVDRLQHAK